MRVVFVKQKTAYEMRISDWSSDVCSSDLPSLLYLERGFDCVKYGQPADAPGLEVTIPTLAAAGLAPSGDRQRVVSGKSASVRVDTGGRRTIKKKKHHVIYQTLSTTHVQPR